MSERKRKLITCPATPACTNALTDACVMRCGRSLCRECADKSMARGKCNACGDPTCYANGTVPNHSLRAIVNGGEYAAELAAMAEEVRMRNESTPAACAAGMTARWSAKIGRNTSVTWVLHDAVPDATVMACMRDIEAALSQWWAQRPAGVSATTFSPDLSRMCARMCESNPLVGGVMLAWDPARGKPVCAWGSDMDMFEVRVGDVVCVEMFMRRGTPPAAEKRTVVPQ